MNKGELVSAVAARTQYPKKQVDAILTAILDTAIAAVANGDEVKLIGFGTLLRKARKGRQGRNPGTGEVIQIPAARVPAFKPSKEFKNKVS